MTEKLSAKLGLNKAYAALAFPATYKPSADEFRDEIERRHQLGEQYVGGLGFARVIEVPKLVVVETPKSNDRVCLDVLETNL